jgi:hypothetical protein
MLHTFSIRTQVGLSCILYISLCYYYYYYCYDYYYFSLQQQPQKEKERKKETKNGCINSTKRERVLLERLEHSGGH